MTERVEDTTISTESMARPDLGAGARLKQAREAAGIWIGPKLPYVQPKEKASPEAAGEDGGAERQAGEKSLQGGHVECVD